MTVFVTGGAGFIGAHVVRHLLRAGHEVVCYDNLFTGRLSHLPREHAGLRVVTADIRDRTAVEAALRGCDALVHLAAIHYIPYCNAHPDETLAVNVGGTFSVLEAARAARLRRVVVASTAAVYPVQDGPCREGQAPGPTDVYGASKVAAEALAHAFAAQAGVAVACARLFNVYGPGETNPHLIPEIVTQLGGGGAIRLGNVTTRRDYVHVRDVAAAVLALLDLERPGCEAYNVGTGAEHSAREIVDTLAAILGRPLTIESDPPRVRAHDRPHLRADITKLREATGWTPGVTLRDGLRDLLAADAGGRVA